MAFQKPGLPEIRAVTPARNPALLEWVTEAFSETMVTSWLSSPAEIRSESTGY